MSDLLDFLRRFVENGIPNDLPLEEAPEFEKTSADLYLHLESVGRKILAICDDYLTEKYGKTSEMSEQLGRGEYSKARDIYVYPTDEGRKGDPPTAVYWHYDVAPISVHLMVSLVR